MFKTAVERWTRFFLRRQTAPVNAGDIDRLITRRHKPPVNQGEIDRLITRRQNEADIDRLITALETEDSECVIRKLEELGEPALIRLFNACEHPGGLPACRYPQDAEMYRALALGRLGKRYPERLLQLVQGRKYLKLATIQGLGYTGDERLKTIAKAALKVFGNDR
jgi:hypothetical protein